MAQRGRRGPLGFLRVRPDRIRHDAEFRRLEEKCRSLSEATAKWHSVLRDMERNGESADPQYGRYFQAYIEAKQLEKRAELELFNLRKGLIG